MKLQSSGLLLFRRRAAGLEVLLVHPGGPFWSRKDNGAWMIPLTEIIWRESVRADGPCCTSPNGSAMS